MKKVTVGRFEIPVSDMDRAISFYQKVFDCSLTKIDMGDFQMAMFPGEGGGVGAEGSLVSHKDFYKSSNLAGVLIYFSSVDLSIELAKVEEAGGNVQIPKRMISPEYGYMGVFLDSEGNRIALHSMS
ncbi:VOC family protein [Algoriphagus sp. D3-2-R+10]|uniref:VOC family protein n=1 Tax=Algoriphagus aurantiacus TaxID=3103948 RepID=UPI002B39D756|nr:VOC family protein [Algoriphagus sp. D3-2-R+10]MEB2775012.1 VOC family protein [Algoriphagus sp. D3-2-R+10]